MTTAHPLETPEGVDVRGPIEADWGAILTSEALDLLALLHRRFAGRVESLLKARVKAQARYDAGDFPDFLEETRSVREGDWTVAPLPEDLLDRRVEITGPPERKMVINALNSGANVFMADFEDSNAPTWRNCVEGQINLRDAIRGTITFEHPTKGTYRLKDETATLLVRPRGWHLYEKHLLVDGQPIPAGLFDFGLYLFHNAKALLKRGTGPYFYLPKLQGHLEARLWNDAFLLAQEHLGLDEGTIKATVLIETLPAAFEMEEILYELREHSSGLNCGRWDYIFSFIKTLRSDPAKVLPDRSQVTMTAPFMRAYTQKVIQVCHRRGVHAMGGMAAQIPLKGDPEANERALGKVRQDKLREVQDGHDGTWVAHPGLVPLAREVFDAHLKGVNQLDHQREDVSVGQEDLLRMPEGGTITESGLRLNIRVGIEYLEAWLGGNGCVPLYGLMEDAATAEISRAQVWQWIRHGARLDDGREITVSLYRQLQQEELAALRGQLGEDRWAAGAFERAAELFEDLSTSEELAEFLTLSAYEHLLDIQE